MTPTEPNRLPIVTLRSLHNNITPVTIRESPMRTEAYNRTPTVISNSPVLRSPWLPESRDKANIVCLPYSSRASKSCKICLDVKYPMLPASIVKNKRMPQDQNKLKTYLNIISRHCAPNPIQQNRPVVTVSGILNILSSLSE
ncbi:hypothetical protein ARMSODRAFT_717150 [Armillaria solidipes]|uniref:Uncharacterized protein n=1 Tax=Armillaria solidipes TaxID=1076256 RepID=A0A2H3BQH4_9AGAR|nr:hypothetical protein ARMSODRAFT_717150 [Armillaria solidipes]